MAPQRSAEGVFIGEPALACESSADADAEQLAGDVCELGTDGFYHHPLQGLQPIDGGFPFLDVHVSPAGQLYALQEGGHGREDGSYEEFDSGVVELVARPIDDDIPATPESEPGYAHDKLGAGVREWINRAQPGETKVVDVLVAKPPADTVTLRLHRAIAEGRVSLHSEREAVRQEILDDVAVETAATLAPVLTLLADRGAEVSSAGEYTTSLRAVLDVQLIEELERRDDVVRLDTLGTSAAASGADGAEKAEAQQHRLFWDESYSCGTSTCNYDGENGTDTDIYVAVVDLEQFRVDHVAFREAPGQPQRIAQLWDCSVNPCASRTGADWSPPVGDHGTGVLGAVLGDLRDGQDPAYAGVTEREQRSAAGGEAKAHLFFSNPDNLPRVMDKVVTRSPSPHFLVSSMGSFTSPPDWTDCNGDTVREGEVDQFFENGFLLFQAAGNDLQTPGPDTPNDTAGIDGSSTNCTVWEPGSAVSAFTVGAYNQGTGAPSVMRLSSVWTESAWGGSPTVSSEGRYRTVVDMLAPWTSDGLPEISSASSYANFIGTSFANPTVGGTAIAFIDMMKNLRSSNMVDDPGMLFAWMLNQGDRGNGGGSVLSAGYDQRYGAGRINLRYVGNAGMDAPWYWYQWEVCVPHGTSVDLPLNNGNAFSTSVDSVRATAWWYDRRFNGGTALDHVSLTLRRTDGTLLTTSNTLDNKQRVYRGGIGGEALKLVLGGTTVTSDVEGCGTNAMRVWVTALIEDDARNDADGPSWDSTNKVGVQPL